ncbi:1378_t:CDS:2 [Entrophospora sp. SA101]|nr:1378_t:CDS:2 [Entrophospora sp. SA101]
MDSSRLDPRFILLFIALNSTLLLFITYLDAIDSIITEAASIYKNAPPSTSIIISPNNNPLSEGLLPSCSIPPLLSASTRRKYKDPGCAVLFILLFATMTLSGLVLLFTTSSTPLKEYAQNSIFFAIRDSTGLFFISIVFSLWMVFLCTYLLRSFVQIFVWVTVKAVPFVGITLFIWTITEAFTGALRESGKPDPQDDW